MKSIALPFAVVACLIAFAKASTTTPDTDAITQYRAYVAAVRAGKIDDAAKLVEPVPPSCKPLLIARLKQAVAVEALKKEMIAQMGSPKMEEDGWAIGGLPYDDLLQNVKGVAQGPNVMVLMTKNPRTKQEGTSAWMVRRNGTWVVPATMVMDVQPSDDPSAPFVEPDVDAREDSIKYADSNRKAVEAVLKRLQNKEFKKPAEVVSAFAGEMKKGAGH